MNHKIIIVCMSSKDIYISCSHANVLFFLYCFVVGSFFNNNLVSHSHLYSLLLILPLYFHFTYFCLRRTFIDAHDLISNWNILFLILFVDIKFWVSFQFFLNCDLYLNLFNTLFKIKRQVGLYLHIFTATLIIYT